MLSFAFLFLCMTAVIILIKIHSIRFLSLLSTSSTLSLILFSHTLPYIIYSYFYLFIFSNSCLFQLHFSCNFLFLGVYISNEAYDYASSSVYYAFHFAHMVILFIGLAFILQAILLITLIATRKVNIMNQYLQVILFVFLFCLLCTNC